MKVLNKSLYRRISSKEFFISFRYLVMNIIVCLGLVRVFLIYKRYNIAGGGKTSLKVLTHLFLLFGSLGPFLII